jgi:hypothetical protein
VLPKSGPYNRFNGNAIRNRAQKKSRVQNGATIAKENNTAYPTLGNKTNKVLTGDN